MLNYNFNMCVVWVEQYARQYLSALTPPDGTQEHSFLLGELCLSHVKEPTSFLSKPRLNVMISTHFLPHLIFCLVIKFISPHVTPHVVKFQVSHGILNWSEQLGTTASQLDSKIWTKTDQRICMRQKSKK